MINISLPQGKASAEPVTAQYRFGLHRGTKVISPGKPHSRCKFLETLGDKELAIRLISNKILDKKPGFDFLNWLGFRKRIILQVKNGDKTGYLVFNAGSIRKRFHLTKKEFYSEVKKNDGDMTSYIQLQIDKRLAHERNAEGCDYLFGRNGKDVNEAKAFELFKKVAAGEYDLGYANLAYCYSHGKGTVQNTQKATEALKGMKNCIYKSEFGKERERFEECALLGVKEVEAFLDDYPKAKVNLGTAYLNGAQGLAVDEKKAFELFNKAADAELILGYSNLAYCYSLGKGVSQDTNHALEVLKKMIEIGKRRGMQDEIADELIRLKDLKVPEIDQICQANPKVYLLMGNRLIQKRDKKIKDERGMDLLDEATKSDEAAVMLYSLLV